MQDDSTGPSPDPIRSPIKKYHRSLFFEVKPCFEIWRFNLVLNKIQNLEILTKSGFEYSAFWKF